MHENQIYALCMPMRRTLGGKAIREKGPWSSLIQFMNSEMRIFRKKVKKE
jgi:hypothetical protein